MTIRLTLQISLVLLALQTANLTQARELAVDRSNLIAVELAAVGIVPILGTPVVLLREPDSGNIVPIFVGPNEARAIILAQRGIEPPRPMTHDLLADVIVQLDGRLSRVIVDEVRDNTYHGLLEIQVGDRHLLIDTRPSDGLALAVRTGATVLVAPAILQAGQDIAYQGLGDEVVTALGITVMVADDELRKALELPDDTGVLVNASQGMALISGIQPGSLIVEVNGEMVQDPMTFLELINATEEDMKVSLRFWHDGDYRTIELDTDVPNIDDSEGRPGTVLFDQAQGLQFVLASHATPRR